MAHPIISAEPLTQPMESMTNTEVGIDAERSRIRLQRRPRSDQRTIDEICHHYVVEKELAEKLRNADKEERKRLYSSSYDEICQRVPNIPGWNVPIPAEALKREIANKVAFLRRFADSSSTFLEIGPGDCSLSLAMAGHVDRVVAVDVSTEITQHIEMPPNFQLIISDGTSIDVPSQSVDVAYSNQLMEHLHPDDAMEQLRNVYQALKPGGVYICVTPSRLSGPHDVSKYFDDKPTGFHLKEYSSTELARTFREAGFVRARPYLWLKERLLILPMLPISILEGLMACLPSSLRRSICNRAPINRLLGRVVAVRP